MVSIQRILCPVDFSPTSQRAIEHAAVIARWYKASITALHVYVPPFVPVPALPPPEQRVAAAELGRVRVETSACLADVRASGIDVAIQVVVGHPAAVILEQSTSSAADLIVMGTHGAGGFVRLLLGSVTEKVLRRASCPVLTVPPHSEAGSTLPFKRLLCAVDFAEPSLSALELASSFAKESGATLTVLHVIEWPWHEPPAPAPDDMPPARATALADFRRYLETSATARLRTAIDDTVRERCATVPRVAHGKPYVEVLRMAVEERADLIVMGVHGRNAADMMLFGSTTNHVVRSATCPVLTLRH